ncbi:MAG TPA: hypothetical protein VL989_03960 [Candidatus Sulfotelmatobacter sp.]|nr:hypothetical protein [Candidatus Sulfotelmatobacter sp.]
MLILVIIALIIACFCGVLFFGAPYLPTLKKQIETMLELAEIKPNQRAIELGCGDGRVVAAFANRQIYVTGYELNPILYLIAKVRCFKYRPYATIKFGDYWRADWPETDIIYTFLLSRYMAKLDKKCIQYSYKPIKLISFAFKIPNKKPAKSKNGLYLYKYD